MIRARFTKKKVNKLVSRVLQSLEFRSLDLVHNVVHQGLRMVPNVFYIFRVIIEVQCTLLTVLSAEHRIIMQSAVHPG